MTTTNQRIAGIEITNVQMEFGRWVAYGMNCKGHELYCTFPSQPTDSEIKEAAIAGYFRYV